MDDATRKRSPACERCISLPDEDRLCPDCVDLWVHDAIRHCPCCGLWLGSAEFDEPDPLAAERGGFVTTCGVCLRGGVEEERARDIAYSRRMDR